MVDILVLFAGNIPKFLEGTKKDLKKKKSQKFLHENRESKPQIRNSSTQLYATEFQCQQTLVCIHVVTSVVAARGAGLAISFKVAATSTVEYTN